MNTDNKKIAFIKCVLYVFTVHFLSIVNRVLYTRGKFEKLFAWDEDIVLFLIQGVIFAILFPIYFELKRGTKKPWNYIISTFSYHWCIFLIVFLLVEFVFKKYSLSLSIYLWELVPLTAFFVLLTLLDTGITFWKTVIWKER